MARAGCASAEHAQQGLWSRKYWGGCSGPTAGGTVAVGPTCSTVGPPTVWGIVGVPGKGFGRGNHGGCRCHVRWLLRTVGGWHRRGGARTPHRGLHSSGRIWALLGCSARAVVEEFLGLPLCGGRSGPAAGGTVTVVTTRPSCVRALGFSLPPLPEGGDTLAGGRRWGPHATSLCPLTLADEHRSCHVKSLVYFGIPVLGGAISHAPRCPVASGGQNLEFGCGWHGCSGLAGQLPCRHVSGFGYACPGGLPASAQPTAGAAFPSFVRTGGIVRHGAPTRCLCSIPDSSGRPCR
jgi:hypothetical protein